MRNLIIAVLSCGILTACDKAPEIQTINGHAQGTTYSVKFWANEPQDAHALKVIIDKELARIDKLMSNYRDDSVIEQFNQQKVGDKALPLDSEILDVLTISNEVYEKSQHCYDPTIKPLFRIWGFKGDKLTIPNAQQIADTLTDIGFNKLSRNDNSITKNNPNLTVDLSAIGQGYAIAQIAKQLKAHGITNHLTEIGGEMLVAGTKPDKENWRVGVERPTPDSQKINEVITVTGKRPTAIMTSGTYRHYFDDNGKRYSHILDPRSGKPVEHDSVAVTVMLENPTYADAWSTALLCLGSKAGLKVANQQQIPAVFYDMEKHTLKRLESQSVKQESVYWNAGN